MKADYIVTAKHGHDPEKVARGHGAKPKKKWKLVDAVLVDLDDAQVEAMRAAGHRVEDNGFTYAADIPWGKDRVNQRTGIDGLYSTRFTGKAVTVYEMDTGIRDSHSEFRRADGSSRVRLGHDVFGGDARDYQGHGTHVGGTIGGKTYGIAPDVELCAVRVLNENGQGTWDGLIDGCEWIAQDFIARGRKPSVVNASIGGGRTEVANDAFNALFDLGIVPCVAAGNDGGDAAEHSPASAERAITVGATGLDANGDFRAGFSNFGTLVDIFAPGVGILSSYHLHDDATATMSGTSMATPHTAGACALALEEFPAASPAEIRARLLETATQGVVQDDQGSTRDLLYSLMDSVQPPDVPVVNVPPVVDIAITKQPTGEEFGYDLVGTVTDAQPIIDLIWNYGDGSVSGHGASPTTSHDYPGPGSYLVTLDAKDSERAIGHGEKMLAIADPNPPDPEPVPDPVIVLTLTVTNRKGVKSAVLSWNAASVRTQNVQVYRKGHLAATAPNNGTWPDPVTFGKGKPAPSYHICEDDGAVCSAETSI